MQNRTSSSSYFHSKQVKIALFVILTVFAAGCVGPQKFVSKTSSPNQSDGYICGMFSGRGQGFGFGIVGVDSKKEYLMPFFEKHMLNTLQKEEVRLIHVLPGIYKLSYWATYDPLSNMVSTKTDLSDQGQISEFEVKPGRVVFIGRYSTSQGSGGYNKINFTVLPQEIGQDDFIKSFKETYPNFSTESVDFIK